MYEKFGQFINGKWSKSSGGETYEVFNPANEELLGKASKANKKDIELALKLDDATMRWSVDKKRDLGTLTELQTEVLNLIPFSPEQISNQEIRKIINRKSSQISEILRKLKRRGHVEGRGYGCYGRVNT